MWDCVRQTAGNKQVHTATAQPARRGRHGIAETPPQWRRFPAAEHCVRAAALHVYSSIRSRMSATVQIGATSAMQLQHGSRPRFTWRQFRDESWVQLLVALGVFALGLGIAATVFIMLGRW